MKFFREKGEGKGSLVLGIVVLLLAAYIGWKVIPVMIRVYAFEDKVREECKFLHNRSMDQLAKDIVNDAEVEDIPLDEQDIDAKKIRVELYEVLRVKIIYSVPIPTPIKVFTWNREVDYEAPVFE
jgi:hypothetical protein